MSLLDRFPSFQQLLASSVSAIRRFPLTFLCTILGTGVAVFLIEDPEPDTTRTLVRMLLTFGLGLPLFIALTLFLEKRQWRGKIALGFQGVGLVLLLAYYFSLPQGVMYQGAGLIRFLLLGLGLHFLVACLPYIGGSQTRGFWQYNMALFQRLLLSAVFSTALFIGLAIALAAADHLFGLEVAGKRYAQLCVIMVGIFNTWVFLAGIPKDFEALDRAREYPKGLAAFAQYILLPLVALYFVILIAYEAKIVITWNWPKGWVSELVLWFAVVGILSLMLLYPLRKQEEKRWIRTFIDWYFCALIPLVAMLFLAILRRISDYGFTEPRYLVLMMAIGLVIVVIYFLISKARDIRIIPILLCAGSLVAAYGPVSASAVSLGSQQNRLEGLLIKNGMLQKDADKDAAQVPTLEDREQMSSIIDYICDWHGREQFSKWLGEEAIDSLDTDTGISIRGQIARSLGFEYINKLRIPGPESIFKISSATSGLCAKSLAVTGYDYLVEFYLAGYDNFEAAFRLAADSCFVSFDTNSLVLKINVGDNRTDTTGAAEFQLSAALDSLVSRYNHMNVPESSRTFSLSKTNYEIDFILEMVSGGLEKDRLSIRDFEGYLLLRRQLPR